MVSLRDVTVNANGLPKESKYGARSEPAHEHAAPHANAPPSATLSPASRACILVPAYQAEKSILAVLVELRDALPELAVGSGLIVIDDGSRDRTGELAARAGAYVVSHGRNRGKGAALATGLATARALGFDVALAVDADGQHPGASARAVQDAACAPGTLVLGVRDLVRDGAPKKNRMSNGISNFFLSRFTGRALADTQCGLRRYPVRETLALASRSEGYAFEAEVLLRAVAAKIPVIEVPVQVRYPPEGERVTHFDSVKDPARIIAVVLRTLHDLRAAARERAP